MQPKTFPCSQTQNASIAGIYHDLFHVDPHKMHNFMNHQDIYCHLHQSTTDPLKTPPPSSSPSTSPASLAVSSCDIVSKHSKKHFPWKKRTHLSTSASSPSSETSPLPLPCSQTPFFFPASPPATLSLLLPFSSPPPSAVRGCNLGGITCLPATPKPRPGVPGGPRLSEVVAIFAVIAVSDGVAAPPLAVAVKPASGPKYSSEFGPGPAVHVLSGVSETALSETLRSSVILCWRRRAAAAAARVEGDMPPEVWGGRGAPGRREGRGGWWVGILVWLFVWVFGLGVG